MMLTTQEKLIRDLEMMEIEVRYSGKPERLCVMNARLVLLDRIKEF